MDIFNITTLLPTVTPPQGTFVGGIRSVMWVERYLGPGEFTIVAPVSSNIRNQLPVGSLISHIDSNVPMLVETHELDADTVDSNEPLITVTGRSLDCVTENRVIGVSEATFPGYMFNTELLSTDVSPRYPWQAAAILIQNCMVDGECENVGDVIPNLEVWYPVDIEARVEAAGYTAAVVIGKTKLGKLSTSVFDFLGEYNMGITASWRPWQDPLSGFPDLVHTTMRIIINKGIDRSDDVVFSHQLEDLADANYLWSNKNQLNGVFVMGRWVSAIGSLPAVGLDSRWDVLDGSDIDQNFSAAPAGTDLDNVVGAMYRRAQQFLAGQRETAITQAQANQVSQRYTYRQDYELGDIVMIDGDYGERRKMMVSEYVEIDDETGESGYPTFAPV